jgi:hypothetical protein
VLTRTGGVWNGWLTMTNGNTNTAALFTLHTVDGETMEGMTLASFLDGNEDMDAATVAAIEALAVGATYSDGGGAAPEWSITRTA